MNITWLTQTIYNYSVAGKLKKGLLLAPLILIIHFLDESHGFVAWLNARVTPGINSESFWSVNFSGLFITLIVIAIAWFASSSFPGIILILWFSFIMGSNALVHIAGAMVDRGYVPGLATAAMLYLPYYCWLLLQIKKKYELNAVAILSFICIGAAPMLVHGYRILFLGTRLF